MQMESPFVMPQEDVEALELSKAFCALRRFLAAENGYVLTPSLTRAVSLGAYRTSYRPITIRQPQHPRRLLCANRLPDSAQHTCNAHRRPSKHGSFTATFSTPSSCPSSPSSRAPRPWPRPPSARSEHRTWSSRSRVNHAAHSSACNASSAKRQSGAAPEDVPPASSRPR